jgi:hypothetical protein
VSTDPAGAALLNPAGGTPLNPAGPANAFDLDQAWRLDERVAVRPEPFGALLYHFGTRRLSFLKNTTMLAPGSSPAAWPPTSAAWPYWPRHT